MFHRALYNSPPTAHSKASHDYIVRDEECDDEQESYDDREKDIDGLEICDDVKSSGGVGYVDRRCVEREGANGVRDVICVNAVNSCYFRVVDFHCFTSDVSR